MRDDEEGKRKDKRGGPVKFPGADYFERQGDAEDEDDEEYYSGPSPVYVDYDSWLDMVEHLMHDLSPECVAAYDRGEFDDELMECFKQGRTPVWAKWFILRTWEVERGLLSFGGDDDGEPCDYEFEFDDDGGE